VVDVTVHAGDSQLALRFYLTRDTGGSRRNPVHTAAAHRIKTLASMIPHEILTTWLK
jgi:hypothetical protein